MVAEKIPHRTRHFGDSCLAHCYKPTHGGELQHSHPCSQRFSFFFSISFFVKPHLAASNHPSRLNNSMASTATMSQFEQSVTRTALRSYLAEFISAFIFVFSVVGSTMSARKMTPNAATSDGASSLVAEAMAHSFALFAAVYMAANVSGGHVNPAVTFGLAVGGHISIPTAAFYWVAQLVGSTMACLLLRLVTAGQAIPTTAMAEEMTGFGGAIVEGVLTFGLVFTFYASGDPKRAPMALGAIGPIAVGLVAGANVLAAGSFTGGSMNPARSFGSAMISGNFKNQGVYWVGPLIGAGVAGLVYQNLISPPPPLESSHGVVESLVI